MQRIEKPLGCIAFWSAGPTRRELLEARLEQVGLAGFKPAESTDLAALRHALELYAETTVPASAKREGRIPTVEPHKDAKANGFEVAVIERGADDNYYTKSFSARLVEGQVEIRHGYANADKIQRLFEEQKWMVHPAAVGKVLASVIASLGGVSLRPTGGVYWLPEADQWEQVIAAIELSGPTKVYSVRTLLNDQTARAVQDAVIAEAKAEADQLMEELTTIKNEEAIERRKVRAEALDERVSRYAELLGEGLEEIKRVTEAVRAASMLNALAGL